MLFLLVICIAIVVVVYKVNMFSILKNCQIVSTDTVPLTNICYALGFFKHPTRFEVVSHYFDLHLPNDGAEGDGNDRG